MSDSTQAYTPDGFGGVENLHERNAREQRKKAMSDEKQHGRTRPFGHSSLDADRCIVCNSSQCCDHCDHPSYADAEGGIRGSSMTGSEGGYISSGVRLQPRPCKHGSPFGQPCQLCYDATVADGGGPFRGQQGFAAPLGLAAQIKRLRVQVQNTRTSMDELERALDRIEAGL